MAFKEGKTMAMTKSFPVNQVLDLLKQTASRELWLDYDKDADVLYINLQRPAVADDSEMTDDGTIIPYLNGKITGYTLINASMHLSVV